MYFRKLNFLMILKPIRKTCNNIESQSLAVYENFHQCRPEPPRLPTKKDVSHLSLQQVSQDSAQDLFNRILPLPYQGGSRIDLHVCCLWIPVVSQGVVCFHIVGLGCSWTFTVIIINATRGSTLFVSMYISFA